MRMTIREAHRWASSFLQQHGTESSDEAHFLAECLLRHVLSWDRACFFACPDAPLPEAHWPELQRLIAEKSKGVPLQHLIGSQAFFGRSFSVSPEVLIPRPETEGLVDEVLKEAAAIWGGSSCSVADIGTGSGAIAVTLAAERPSWHITAIDLSATALETARQNAARHGVDSRICFLAGDLLQPIIEDGQCLDIVVSNPPYIPSRVIETLAVEVKHYEPRLALDGGGDGLDMYRQMAASLPHVMKQDKGLVAVEVGMGQSRQVAHIVGRVFPYGKVKIVPDLAGIERVVLIRWS